MLSYFIFGAIFLGIGLFIQCYLLNSDKSSNGAFRKIACIMTNNVLAKLLLWPCAIICYLMAAWFIIPKVIELFLSEVLNSQYLFYIIGGVIGVFFLLSLFNRGRSHGGSGDASSSSSSDSSNSGSKSSAYIIGQRKIDNRIYDIYSDGSERYNRTEL